MPSKKQDEFISIATQHGFDAKLIQKYFAKNGKSTPSVPSINNRIANYRRKGLLPLDSGNSVDIGQHLVGTSTLFDSSGNIKQQWVKSDATKEATLEAFQKAISNLSTTLPPAKKVPKPETDFADELATVYISNDVHFGLLTWKDETGLDWDTNKATETMKKAYDYLFDTSPKSKIGIVVDLGDLVESDDFTNLTPNGKNPLDTDSRYPKILRAAYESLIYAVNKALQKHEIVHFYNIAGNHDVSSGHAVREVIMAVFKDNPRVKVCGTSSPIKYHQHGKTLLGFAHGDGLKMPRAGETMAIDNEAIFSSTEHRFFHFGHTHVDAVRDGAICRCESHRNIAPLNHWAYHKGFRRGCGTMKSITYSTSDGEVSRQIFNLTQERLDATQTK